MTLHKVINILSPEELLKHAQLLQKTGRLQEATIAFEKLKSLYPKFPPILNDLAILYLQQGKFNEGRQLLEKSLQLDPKQPMALYNLGKAYQNQGKFNEASTAYKQVTKIQPQFADAYFSRGICLHFLERFAEAIMCFEDVIRFHPEAVHAYNAKGISLYHAGNYSDALVALQKALALNQQSPEIYNNLGLAYHKLNQFDAALENYNLALTINPNYADAYSNRGLTYQALKNTTEALKDYDRCLQIEPNHPDVNWNKALIKIQLGEYQEGWALYEWRWQSFSKKWARHYEQPLWLGESSIKDKNILIYPEQGYGDFIQFCRYIPKLLELGAKVILETPAPLMALTASSFEGNIQLIESGKALPKFDVQCPIISLPLAFKTTLKNIPSTFPYLKTDPNKVQLWQEKLGKKTKPRLGLVWSGSTWHKNDHNRSIPFQTLLPLFDLPLEFHCLQKEIRKQDSVFFNKNDIQNHQQDLKDFSNTAALIDQMDVVISVDTAVAHLAGALGKKLLLLLPSNPDYRWMLDKKDSLWYPSAKLLRQSAIGDWSEVMEKLKTSLANL